jgi:hypothetical protein
MYETADQVYTQPLTPSNPMKGLMQVAAIQFCMPKAPPSSLNMCGNFVMWTH